MLYNLLHLFLYLVGIFIYIISKRKREFIKKRLFSNYDSLEENKEYNWIHCSSVGEINLSDSFIKKLLEEKNEDVLISVFTDTGYNTAKKKYSDIKRIKIIFFPLDNYFKLKKIISKINIKTLFVVETEIWPNLISLVSKKSKVVVINGRISDKSFGKYKKLRFILKNLLEKKIDAYYMQTEVDRDRIIELGANNEKVFVTGNLKFDIECENYSEEEKDELKKIVNPRNKKIFVCGSTRSGEYETLIEAYKNLEDYIMILVPRHLERIPNIEVLLKEKNLSYKKLSDIKPEKLTKIKTDAEMLEGKKNSEVSYNEINNLKIGEEKNGDFDILIVDRMGILRKMYSICDIAFVGGTLVNIGGHSLLEPLFYRKIPIFGKHIGNVRDISKEILRKNIGIQIETAEEILEGIKKIENQKFNIKEIDDFFNKNNRVAEKIMKNL